MRDIGLTLIKTLHFTFILFMLLAPFADSNYLFLLHSIAVPFLFLHWATSDHTCVLTVIERLYLWKRYGKVDESNCFTCKLLYPVFDFAKNQQKRRNFLHTVLFLLWLLTLGQLGYKIHSGKVTSYKQLFKL